MENIIQIIDPIVGKFYVVTCAWITEGNKELFIPIIGQKHSDNQFGFPHSHYHMDGRFTNNRNNKTGYTNDVIVSDANFLAGYSFKGLVTKKKKCIRVKTGLRPPKNPKSTQQKCAGLYVKWVNSMIGKSCKGRKCPHLNQEMHLIDGVLVCPLHNLKACPEKEIITGYLEV